MRSHQTGLKKESKDPDNEFKSNLYVNPAVRMTLNASLSFAVSIDPFVAAPPIVTTPVVFTEFRKSSATVAVAVMKS